MARETKEERQARNAQMEQERLASVAAYKASVPLRLSTAVDLAKSVGIYPEVTLTKTGPSVHFYDDNARIDITAWYEMEEWELEFLEEKLQGLKDAQDARKRRREIAETVWAEKLTQQEKQCVKEFISYLSAS